MTAAARERYVSPYCRAAETCRQPDLHGQCRGTVTVQVGGVTVLTESCDCPCHRGDRGAQ